METEGQGESAAGSSGPDVEDNDGEEEGEDTVATRLLDCWTVDGELVLGDGGRSSLAPLGSGDEACIDVDCLGSGDVGATDRLEEGGGKVVTVGRA